MREIVLYRGERNLIIANKEVHFIAIITKNIHHVLESLNVHGFFFRINA
jgi:hypothetical protein